MRKRRRERRVKDPYEDKENLLRPHRSTVDQKHEENPSCRKIMNSSPITSPSLTTLPRAVPVWKGSWDESVTRRCATATRSRCQGTALTPTTTGSRPSPGRSVGSTWTTTSSRTTRSETPSPRHYPPRRLRVCAYGCSTTGSVAWTYLVPSGRACGKRACRSRQSTHPPLDRR